MFFEDSSDNNCSRFHQNMNMSEDLLHYKPIDAVSVPHISNPNEL